MMKHFKIIFSFILIVSAFAFQSRAQDDVENKDASKKDVASKSNYMICRNKKTVRTVAIHRNKAGGCTTIYTKNGSDENIGGGKNNYTCSKIMGNIRTNLGAAGWKCKEFDSAEIVDTDASNGN
jgi:hypothetical protein